MTRFAADIDLTDYLDDSDWSMATEATADGRSSNRITSMDTQADVASTGISAAGQKAAADYDAASSAAIASAKASAKTFGAITDGISSLAGGGIAAYGRANSLGKYAK